MKKPVMSIQFKHEFVKKPSMAQHTEQMFVDPNVMSSNPTASTSHSRIFDFLEDIAKNARGESTAIDRKIAQLKMYLKEKLLVKAFRH